MCVFGKQSTFRFPVVLSRATTPAPVTAAVGRRPATPSPARRWPVGSLRRPARPVDRGPSRRLQVRRRRPLVAPRPRRRTVRRRPIDHDQTPGIFDNRRRQSVLLVDEFRRGVRERVRLRVGSSRVDDVRSSRRIVIRRRRTGRCQDDIDNGDDVWR